MKVSSTWNEILSKSFFYNFFTTQEPSMYRKLLQRKLKRYYIELYELSHQSEAKLK